MSYETASGIAQLTGDMTAGPGSGSQVATLAASGASAGTYLGGNITIDAKGRVTSAVAGVLAVVSSSPLTKTSDTALANVPGLSVALAAGKTYLVTAILYVNSASASGLKIALANNDTLTVTSIAYGAVLYTSAAASAPAPATALGTALGATSAVALCVVTATIVVNAAGTLVVQAAQNVSGATSSIVLVNSSIDAVRIT